MIVVVLTLLFLIDQKICTRNQENEAREDKTSEWDCVTEGNRKICIKHGAEKWY